jgi:hypothetical protein
MKAETVRVMAGMYKNQKLVASFGTVEFDAQGIGLIPVAFAEVFSKMKGFAVLDALPAPQSKDETTNPSIEPEKLAKDERQRATSVDLVGIEADRATKARLNRKK